MSTGSSERPKDDLASELRLGDCLDKRTGLPSLPAGSCDLLLTDPPYAVAGGYHKRSGHTDDQFFGRWMSEIAEHVIRVLKPEGCGFVFCDWKTVGIVREAFGRPLRSGDGWSVPQALVWDREGFGLGSPFRNAYEMIAFVRGPAYQRRGIGTTTPTIVRCRWPYTEHRNHPAEKPVELLEQLVRWGSEPGGIVLDPFTGSGTTGVAAKKNGRQFFGFEKRPEFHAAATERIAREG